MTGVPTTPDMHFRNGSIAIAYIGTVLLQLRDKGVLGVDDKLSKWFPEYPRSDQITLTMLINGTSGYADFVTDQPFLQLLYADPFRHWSPGELIAIGLNRPMMCDPGTCWSYAHTNFVILGKVLEMTTGRPLQDLIREGILDPLSLTDTRSEATAVIQEPVLHAFDAERGRYEEFDILGPVLDARKRRDHDIEHCRHLEERGGHRDRGADLARIPRAAARAADREIQTVERNILLRISEYSSSMAGSFRTRRFRVTPRRWPICRRTGLRSPSQLPCERRRQWTGIVSTVVLKEIAAYMAPEAPLR